MAMAYHWNLSFVLCNCCLVILFILSKPSSTVGIGTGTGINITITPNEFTTYKLPEFCESMIQTLSFTQCNNIHDSILEPYKNWNYLPEFARCCASNALKSCFIDHVTEKCGPLYEPQLNIAFEISLKTKTIKNSFKTSELAANCYKKKYYDYTESPLCWSFEIQIIVLVLITLLTFSCLLICCCCMIKRLRARKATNKIKQSAAIPTTEIELKGFGGSSTPTYQSFNGFNETQELDMDIYYPHHHDHHHQPKETLNTLV